MQNIVNTSDVRLIRITTDVVASTKATADELRLALTACPQL